MSCELPIDIDKKSNNDCKCYNAVMQAYENLINIGKPKSIAFDAAKIIYGYHHPEESPLSQTLTVQGWTNRGNIH